MGEVLRHMAAWTIVAMLSCAFLLHTTRMLICLWQTHRQHRLVRMGPATPLQRLQWWHKAIGLRQIDFVPTYVQDSTQ